MLHEEQNEERSYEDYLESTLKFCRQADSELKVIENEIINQDRELLFKHWDIK